MKRLLYPLAAAFAAVLWVGCAHQPRRSHLVLAENGEATMPIVLAADAIPAETTAARELADHLQRMTGATFAVVGADAAPAGPAIHVGPTPLAQAQGMADFGPEESLVRTVDGSLVLVGGRPRGTLYAVYRFLEDDLGCRWYTPWADLVPNRPTLAIPALDRRLTPVFAQRDAYTRLPDRTWSADQKAAWFTWVARNRLNGRSLWGGYVYRNTSEGAAELQDGGDTYGGCYDLRFGGPHTFARHFPADKYFDEHPEWYSMRAGKRVPSTGLDGNHLCLTNKELRAAYIDKLRGYMRANPHMHLFSVAMNDGGCKTPCDCPACTAAIAAGSTTDLYVDFLNHLADGVRDEFPANEIWTIAYSFAAQPPQTVRPRDNIRIMACLLTSNRVQLDPPGTDSLDGLAAWTHVSNNVHVWDYVEWGMPFYFLYPTQYRSAAQLRRARDLGVVGVFAENEVSASQFTMTEQYPMRLWIYSKLQEDPDRDPGTLVEDYVGGVYGPAGPILLPYFQRQRERLQQWPQGMLDFAFYDTQQREFDAAEAVVAGQAVYLERVRDARLWADLGGLFAKNRLAADYVHAGHTPASYPYPATMLLERVLLRLAQTRDLLWLSGTPDRSADNKWTLLVDLTARYARTVAQGNDYAPLPAPFRDLPPDRVVDIPGYQMARVRQAVVTEDPQSVFGVVAARPTKDDNLPLEMGVYDHTTKGYPTTATVEAAQVPGPGYHVYPVGRTTISPRCVFYFTRTWEIGQRLEMLHDPTAMNQEWDVYVSARFGGPAYPYGKADEPDGVYLERLILVRVEE